MNENTILTKMFPVSNFDRVVLRAQHENRLNIVQGEREALTIQAPAEVLARIRARVRSGSLEISLGGDWKERLSDALTTSLTRPEIAYTLRVKQLASLDVYAMAFITAEHLNSKHLSVRFNGPGVLHIEDLAAQQLDIELTGASRVDVSGIATEQNLTLRGLAQYDARRLQSKRTEIEMTGAGIVTVWALEHLGVDIRGPGSVAYLGMPKVSENLSPLASLTHLEGSGVPA
ncbi:MAG TPA: DUF2807 domain-containing protein [Anaerolineales bacterium]|nr:DUF2807 domain-containing protein [Anaerolineales bacterium]